MKELPLSIQTFENIISRGMVYVDKTAYIHSLLRKGKYYFLSRPRRFGKSLLLTTLKAFFQGKKELFEGLYLYDKVDNWDEHPVIHLDYSLVDYRSGLQTFKESLRNHLVQQASTYQIALNTHSPSDVLVELVLKLHQQTQRSVVILVDEYDKPLVDMLGKESQFFDNREVLRGLYGAMKGLDDQLRFVMLTGVSRFAKVGVFSGMNNLDDISMNKAYAGLAGFSQTELETYFADHLQHLAETFSQQLDVLMTHVREWYNGFSFDGETRLYNPYSILKLFTEWTFRNYWFSSGTPSFLMDLIVNQKQLPETFESLKVSDLTGSSMQLRQIPLVPLLFQTGYLTIERTELDGVRPYYFLNYPNEEVRHSFLTFIAAAFKQKDQFEIQPEALALRDSLLEENVQGFVAHFESFLSDIPSRLHLPREAYYHSLVYLMLRIVGAKALLEKETSKGRIDAVLEFPDKIYIIEFKFARQQQVKSPEVLSQKALKQIKDNGYVQPYLGQKKRILLLGLGFLDQQLHGRLEEWS
ncbi:MAG: AAA family ATPase, partial [Bacteroidota bacterium]